MVRIIPWNLPPVNGGSIGGYTPKVEPTPEPTPIPYNFPYILDDIVIVDPTIVTDHGSWKSQKLSSTLWLWTQTDGNSISMGLSGVEIVDAQNVSSVIATVKVSGTMVRTYYYNADFVDGHYPTATKTDSDLNVDVLVDITSIMTKSGGNRSATANIGGTVESVVGRTNSSTAPGPPWADGVAKGGQSSITTTPTITLEKITVYNGNGVAIQEWTPPEEEGE